MRQVKAGRRMLRGKALLIALLVTGVTATAAVAATFNGDGVFVGTSGNDTFNLGNGNDTAYGLLGKDTINAGNGNDLIDGDGQCGQGSQNGMYCQDGPIRGDGGDTINAGNGNDTVFGGGGHNTINVGAGSDTIFGGPIGDTINVNGGRSYDLIVLGAGGGNTVNLSSGHVSGYVFAQNGHKDTINCNGSPATVYADTGIDVVNNCPNVKWSSHHARDLKRASTKRTRHHARQARHTRNGTVRA
jgi:Ca2+-binding RTX toxin-like protein